MMEIAEDPCTLRHGSPEESVPSLIQYISANEMADIDTINEFEGFPNHNSKSRVFSVSSMETKESAAKPQSVSISMPPTPTGYHFHGSKTSLFTDQNPAVEQNPESTCAQDQTDARFYSQQMPKGAMYMMHSPQVQPNSARDTRFDSFKTWSGKLERQLTTLRGRPVEPEPETRKSHHLDTDALPVDRYFDALEGPELDTLRAFKCKQCG